MILVPGDDWCAALNAAAPGDTITLSAGDYEGPCTINQGGEAGQPITLKAEDPQHLPHIVYTGRSDNVLNVQASHLVISGLVFGPTQADIDAIKIKSGSDIIVENSLFEEIGGISISANSADGGDQVVRGCTFSNLQATALYFGCHDGSCTQSNVLIEGNVFDGVQSTAVGYAMEIKLDSSATIRHNAIRDTKGPGIEIYGSSDLAVSSTVEGNIVWGGASGAIEIGGGPALVRNNIVIASQGGGIFSYDYGARGLVHGVHILGNTAIAEAGEGFVLQSWQAGQDLEFSNNVVYAVGGQAALPERLSDGSMVGNLSCGNDCFVDAANLNLWPSPQSPLIDAGGVSGEDEIDFCGNPRDASPDIGVFEDNGTAGPGVYHFGPIADYACPSLPTADDSGLLEDSAAATVDKSDGCGCVSAQGAGGGFWLGLGLWVSFSRTSGPNRKRR